MTGLTPSAEKMSWRREWVVAAMAIGLTGLIAWWLGNLRGDVADPRVTRIFLSLIVFQDYPAALLMLAVTPLALFRPVQSAALEVTRWCGDRPFALAAMTVTGLSVATLLAYHAHPLSMDEYAATFQARIFAAGRLYGQLPPDLIDWLVPKGFQGYFLAVSHERGLAASVYWPGWALILTPFTALGVPWLANPMLGGLAVFVVHRLVLRLTKSISAAGLAALLTAASPAFSVNAFSFYSMNAHLVCNAAFTLALISPTPLRALAAGGIGSLALTLHNPVPHLLYALPWFAWLVSRDDRFRLIPALVVGYLPLGLAIGLGWTEVIARLNDTVRDSALGTVGAKGFIETWLRVLRGAFRIPHLDLLEDRLFGMAKLWLWAAPSLLLLAVFGLRKAMADLRFRLIAWSVVVTLIGYLFVPFDQGHGWGFRYFHSVWFALPVFASALFANRPGLYSGDEKESKGPRSLLPFAAACALLSLVVLTPFRAWQVERFVAGHLAQIPSVATGSVKVVLVRWRAGYYAADLVQNDPFLRREPIMMIAQGEPADSEMISSRFPSLVVLAESPAAIVFGIDDR